MATIGTAVTLLDLKTGMDPKGAPAQIIEVLDKDSEIIQDMPWVEGNLPTGHQHSVRTGLPTPAWRMLNYGVPQTKGTQVTVTDSCGMLEDYSQIDKRLLKLNGHSAGWRMQQDKPHLEGMNQAFASTLFYGNTAVDPEKFLGLAPRFDALSTSEAQTATNTLTATGTTANVQTSIWLIGWGANTVHGIYPKGSTAGLDMEDLGEDTSTDSNGLMYQVMRSHFQWDCGLAVPDWRYVVRICNIEVSTLTFNAATGPNLHDLLIQACERIQGMSGVTPRFYANRRITTFLRRQAAQKANLLLSLDTLGGKSVLNFDGIPIRRTDAILNTEAVVA